MATKVTVVARLQAKPGKEEEVLRELLHLVDATRREDGCLNYDLHISSDTLGLYLFYENWTSKAHLDRHAQSPHIQAFRVKGPDLLAAPVEITLWEMVSDPARGQGLGIRG